MNAIKLFVSVLFLWSLIPVYAQTYTYTDEKGVKHFVSSPSRIPESHRDKIEQAKLPKISSYAVKGPSSFESKGRVSEARRLSEKSLDRYRKAEMEAAKIEAEKQRAQRLKTQKERVKAGLRKNKNKRLARKREIDIIAGRRKRRVYTWKNYPHNGIDTRRMDLMLEHQRAWSGR